MKAKILSVVIVLTLVLCATLGAANPSAAGGPSGFRALTGQAAREFRLPPGLEKQPGDAKSLDLSVERYQQRYGKALVLGGQLSIYRDASGVALAVIGAHYPDLAARNQVRLNNAEARRIAASQISDEGDWLIDLMLDPQTERYFYQVDNQRFDFRWITWIDAETGEVLQSFDGLTTGSGIGVLGDTKDLTGLTTYSSSVHKLLSTDGRQTTYDARNKSKLPGTLATDSNDIWDLAGRTSPGQPALVDAQYYARVTDNYYLNKQGFNWKTYFSQGMVSTAHYKSNYANAFWNGTQMVYGDGDGVTFRELSGELDVVGHELSHGVTSATSKLVYLNQSGALSESFSDIMGTSVEFYYGTGNWTVGEDITIGDNGIRNLANPLEDGDPSHWLDYVVTSSDNGGVHTNCGIPNHWFYLLVNGGQNANPVRASGTNVVGIGLASTERIAYLGFTALPSSATFCNARTATIAVAGAYAANVADAWDEVGMTATVCGQ